MNLKSFLMLLLSFSYVISTHAGIDSDIPSDPDTSENMFFIYMAQLKKVMETMKNIRPLLMQYPAVQITLFQKFVEILIQTVMQKKSKNKSIHF